jgi:hypothetical protein
MPKEAPSRMLGGLVTVEPSTARHTYLLGQTLFVTAGAGLCPCDHAHVAIGMIDTWADTTLHPRTGKRIQVWL